MLVTRWSLSLLGSLEFRLPKGEGNVAKPYHMLNLPLHSDAKQGYEVHDKDGPEDWDVEELPEGTEEGYCRGLGGRIPEFELGQPSDERSELLVLICRKLWTIFICI